MKSGLEDRNNGTKLGTVLAQNVTVSMKSGLEDRNNCSPLMSQSNSSRGLNEVRPGRPEQSEKAAIRQGWEQYVSMKSGLEDRNNCPLRRPTLPGVCGLNEVRPGRPEQYPLIRNEFVTNLVSQ